MRPAPLALTLALSALAAVPVAAGFGNAHRPSSLPWSDAVQVARFDPASGQLVGVRLVVDAFVRADLAAENAGRGPDLVQAHAAAIVQVALPDGGVVAELPFDSVANWVLGPFDGAQDFAGASGRSIHTAGRRRAEVVIDDPASLLYFLGEPGVGGVIELPVSASGVSAILGGQGLVGESSLSAGVRVRAEYLVLPYG